MEDLAPLVPAQPESIGLPVPAEVASDDDGESGGGGLAVHLPTVEEDVDLFDDKDEIGCLPPVAASTSDSRSRKGAGAKQGSVGPLAAKLAEEIRNGSQGARCCVGSGSR